MGNTYFKYKNLPKYTRLASGQDGVEIKSMIVLVLMKRDMLQYVQECKGGERNEKRPLRPPCCTV